MSDTASIPALYVHTRRPQWGLAILAEEAGDKRRFLFQDGKMRAFKEGFFDLLQPADKPLDVLMRVGRSLALRLGKTARQRSVLTSSQSEVVRLSTQIEVFRKLFPGGFRDEAYIEKHRGVGAKRRLKRHLEAAAESAQRLLARDELDALLAQGAHGEVHARASEVIQGTHLCAAAAAKAVTQLPAERHADFAAALRDVLYGDEPYYDRFTRLVAALQLRKGKPVKWTVATLFPALVDPAHHVAVKARPFAQEARWLAPQLVVGKTPDAIVYERLRTMAHRLFADLTERGMAPRDMLDIRTFIAQSFRPKHLELLRSDRDD